MANAFSVQADFGDYIQPINTDLVNFVLSSKQQKYDYNVAKIDATIAEFGIDLERESDKDYVIQKLNGVLDSVNNLGKMDLSNNNITRDIQQQIRGTLDERMIGAAVSTQNYRKFQGTLQQARKDGTYSDINAGYAMDRGGVGAWLNNQSDELGSVSYTPYQDVNAKVTKNIKELKAFNPERTVDIPFQDAGGVNRIISKKVKDLNEAELRSYVMSNLDENSQKQLQINGWAKFNGASDEDLNNYAVAYRDGRNKQYDTNIALTRKQLETAPAYMAQDLRDRLNVLQSEKNSFTATMNNIGSDRDNIGRVIMQEQLVDDVSRAYADTSVSYELKTDTAYYENAKLEFNKVKFLTEQAAKAKTSATTPSGDVTDSSQIRSITTPITHQEDFNPEERTKDRIAEQESKTNALAKNILQGLDQETKQIFANLKEADPTKSDAELLDSMNLDLVYEDEEGNPRFFKEAMNELKDTYEDATVSYKKTMEESFEENIGDVYREITSQGFANNNQFPLIQEDGSLTRMDEYLAQNNISEEDFRNNKDGIQDRVKKSLYLNKALSQATKSITANSAGKRNATISTEEYLLSPGDLNKLDNYMKVSDADDSIFNYVDFVNPTTGEKLKKEDVDSVGEEVFLSSRQPFVLQPKTKEAKGMLKFFRDRKGITIDSKVDDDGRLGKIIDFDTPEFKKKLTRNFAAQSSNSLVIDPNLGKGGKEVNDVHQQMQRFANSKGMTEPAKDKPFIVAESLHNPNELIISQNDEDSNPIVVSKVEVEKLMGKELPSSKGREITINKEIVNRDIAPFNMSKAAHQDKAEVVTGMIARGEVLGSPKGTTKAGLKEAVSFTVGYKDAEGNNTPAGNLADFIISNDFDNLSIAYRPKNKNGVVTIMNKATQEEIQSYPVSQGQIQLYRNTVRYNPQLFMNELLVNMVDSFKNEQERSELYSKLVQSQNGGQQ